MQRQYITIIGRVIHQQSKSGISGLHIDVLDKNKDAQNILKSAETDKKGVFEIKMRVSDLPGIKNIRDIDDDPIVVYFDLHDGSKHIKTTGGITISNKSEGELYVTIHITDDIFPGDAKKAPVRVSVHKPGGSFYEEDATVLLTNDTDQFVLAPIEPAGVYTGHVPPGTYTLSIETAEMHAPSRTLVVPLEGKVADIYLGQPGWPHYRLGENIVPFEPYEDLVAVVFPTHVPDSETITRKSDEIQASLPLEPFEFNEEEKELPFTAGEGSIWLFRLTEKPDKELRISISDEIQSLIKEEIHVGIPVDLIPTQLTVIGNRYVVQFHDSFANVVEDIIASVNGNIIRDYIQAKNTYLIEFPAEDYREHLQLIENWIEEGLLVYGEPDILYNLRDHAFPITPPNDPVNPYQENLTTQNVYEAWRILHAHDPNVTLGNPDVYVATIDTGVELDHPDIVGTLTDGHNQLAECYDFFDMQRCSAPGYAPYSSHGMGVYGIIAARTNNERDISGIAPNTHQIALKRPASLDTSNYADILLWAAGFRPSNTTQGWPRRPIGHAADIISCSHGVAGLALSGLMNDTLNFLTNHGRGGKGTIVIYAAGNSNQSITGNLVWAAHPRTLAISNSGEPNRFGRERKVLSSNYGLEIDICARGDDVYSLARYGRIDAFGGTSAAAPTVAAAAALMLSIEPELTWDEVRDILRDTADKIDPFNRNRVGRWRNGFSQWYGYGRLNIGRAVREARDLYLLRTAPVL